MGDMTDEMVERAAKAVAAFLHAGEFQSPDQNWAQMSKHQKAQARALVQTVTAAIQVQAQGVPEGWKLVPVEPTPQMRQAFHAAHEEYEGGSGVAPDLQWQAMLAAAPLPAPPAEDGKNG